MRLHYKQYAMESNQIIQIKEQQFEELFIRDGGVRVVELFEANNGTCEMMRPVVESANIEFAGKVEFFIMDVTGLDEFITRYRIHRKPSFFLIRGDEIVDTIAGLVPMSRFFRFIQEHIE